MSTVTKYRRGSENPETSNITQTTDDSPLKYNMTKDTGFISTFWHSKSNGVPTTEYVVRVTHREATENLTRANLEMVYRHAANIVTIRPMTVTFNVIFETAACTPTPTPGSSSIPSHHIVVSTVSPSGSGATKQTLIVGAALGFFVIVCVVIFALLVLYIKLRSSPSAPSPRHLKADLNTSEAPSNVSFNGNPSGDNW